MPDFLGGPPPSILYYYQYCMDVAVLSYILPPPCTSSPSAYIYAGGSSRQD